MHASARRLLRLAGSPGTVIETLAAGPLLVGIALWAASLPRVDLRGMTDLGLLSVLPATMYLALGALTLGFFLALGQRQVREWLLAAHVLVLIFVIHGTPSILYGTLRYAWAWKHVGIVDYIDRHGSVDPDIGYLAPYHNWPGFFALSALFTKLAGFQSALSFASWAPVFFNLLFLAALVALFRTFTTDRRLLWLAVWLFFVSDWVGQDYFSPQAFTYFLYLVLLAICLAWFRLARLPEGRTIARWVRHPRLATAFGALLRRADPTAAPAQEVMRWQRVGLAGLVVALTAVIASSHQLTPVMAFAASVVLVVFQRIRLRALPLAVGVMTAAWIAFAAVGFLRGNLYWIVDSIGRLQSNTGATFINLARASAGQVEVARIDRALTLTVVALGAAGFVRRLRAGSLDLTPGLLAASPIVMLWANAYGGEMLFRVYFFALPFVVFLAAGLVFPSPAAGRSQAAIGIAAVLSGALLAAFLFGYYGKERQNYFTSGEVRAATYLTDIAAPGAVLVDGINNYPRTFRNYEKYSYISLDEEPPRERRRLLAQPAAEVARLIDRGGYPAAYVIITRSQKAAVDATGIMPAGSLELIEEALARSRRFSTAFRSADAAIFRYPAPEGTR